MKLTTTLNRATILAFALTFTVISSTQVIAQSTPGFVEAVFDKATLNGVLKNSEAVSLRFYNVMESADASQGTVMVVAVRADGSEINEGLFAKPYHRCDGLNGEFTNVKKLSCNRAEGNCTNISSAGYISYSATFPKATVTGLLGQNGANGLRVEPAQIEGGTSMEITAVAITGGSATDVGSGSEAVAIDPEPCPVMCGDDNNYINR